MLEKKCNHCYKTFEDDDRVFCPYCGEILDPELKLAADFHKIHQDYQASLKREKLMSIREAQAEPIPVPKSFRKTTGTNKSKVKQNKKQPSKKASAVQHSTKNKTKKSNSAQFSVIVPAVVFLAIAAVFFLFTQLGYIIK